MAISDAITEIVMLASKDQPSVNGRQSSFHISVLSSRSLDAEAVNWSFNCFHLAVPQHGNSMSLVSLL